MKLFRVILLVLVLLAPVVNTASYILSNEDSQCELFENLSEEEEGDDNETEDFEESEYFKQILRAENNGFFYDDATFKLYLEHHPDMSSIELEVQTPPPKNTMC